MDSISTGFDTEPTVYTITTEWVPELEGREPVLVVMRLTAADVETFGDDDLTPVLVAAFEEEFLQFGLDPANPVAAVGTIFHGDVSGLAYGDPTVVRVGVPEDDGPAEVRPFTIDVTHDQVARLGGELSGATNSEMTGHQHEQEQA